MSDGVNINSCYPIVLAADPAASRDFYRTLVGLVPVWENDWFVLLQAPDRPEVQLAFVRPDHDSVPQAFRSAKPAGVVITLEVPDATAARLVARAAGVEIARELRDEEFGQRHFMVVDPDGLLVDVVEQIFVADPGAV
jgi:catechol 2,3-dioxygenase-like lactoylglutathione lyase family enzyme